MKREELKDFMDAKYFQYNNPKFIASDPIQVPHRFTRKEDIEISAFLTATIAWGNRKSIINNATKMMQFLDNDPFNFIMHHSQKDLKKLIPFVHRTFNGTDLIQFVKSLNHIYKNHQGLEQVFGSPGKSNSLQGRISCLKQLFFEIPHPERSRKHISDPSKGSAAKRINMFLRWMVRNDTAGVDFGLWKSIPAARLSCPLDVHSGRVARSLGLLVRKQNDAKAVSELDTQLRNLDADDPVKYDYALFGLGVFEKW